MSGRIHGRNDFFTYKLVRPNGIVFYVGMACAIWGEMARFRSHLLEAQRGIISPKCEVIREILASGEEVGFVKDCENLSYHEALSRECELVSFYGRDNLTNKTDGGKGANGKVYTLEERTIHRARMAEWREKRRTKKEA